MLLYGLEKDPDFQQLDVRLLVSCPASGPDEGGLFMLDFRHNSLTRLYTGSCSGMTLIRNRLIVATDDQLLLTFNHRYELIAKTKHPRLDFHGVARWNDRIVLVVETAVNAIGCYETDTFERIGEIRFHADNRDVHHLNDLWLDGSTLYVSMFSPHDRWYANPLEKSGAIVAVDLTGFQPGSGHSLIIAPNRHIVVDGLHMPHTVMVHKDKIAYCDSMSFSAHLGHQTVQLAGFTRGMAFTDQAVFIGQSRMRHVLRIPHQFSNCILDGGIYVYHPEYRISRFVSLPAQQVYQILVLNQESS